MSNAFKETFFFYLTDIYVILCIQLFFSMIKTDINYNNINHRRKL